MTEQIYDYDPAQALDSPEAMASVILTMGRPLNWSRSAMLFTVFSSEM
ncbi:hypothetical protein X778_13550 [Pseudomonas aeruginosa VRFPA07]|nr:hypothetical protein X778_13550 [Pseudomonas aeruginosa VRFPA07]